MGPVVDGVLVRRNFLHTSGQRDVIFVLLRDDATEFQLRVEISGGNSEHWANGGRKPTLLANDLWQFVVSYVPPATLAGEYEPVRPISPVELSVTVTNPAINETSAPVKLAGIEIEIP